MAPGHSVSTITNEHGSETMTVEEFRRRRGLVYCARCDSHHPKGRCPFIPMTTASRKRTALGQYAPRRDGIDAW